MDKRLLVLALGMFALGTDSFVMAGILPQISHAFAVPVGAAGQMTSVYAVTYALMAPTMAAIAAQVFGVCLRPNSIGSFPWHTRPRRWCSDSTPRAPIWA